MVVFLHAPILVYITLYFCYFLGFFSHNNSATICFSALNEIPQLPPPSQTMMMKMLMRLVTAWRPTGVVRTLQPTIRFWEPPSRIEKKKLRLPGILGWIFNKTFLFCSVRPKWWAFEPNLGLERLHCSWSMLLWWCKADGLLGALSGWPSITER